MSPRAIRTIDGARKRDLIDALTAARMMDAKVSQIDRLAKVARLTCPSIRSIRASYNRAPRCLPVSTFGTFWGNVEVLIRRGEIRSVDVVRDELKSRDDDTRKWASKHSGLFVPLRREIQLATKKVLSEHPRLMGVGNARSLLWSRFAVNLDSTCPISARIRSC